MKATILTFSAVLMMGAAAATAQTNPMLSLVEGKMMVDLTLPLRGYDVKSNQSVVLTPMLVNGTDTLRLDGVSVYGRTRYIQWQRGNTDGIPSTPVVYKASQAPEAYHYEKMIDYQPMLDGAQLIVEQRRYGCAGCGHGLPELTEGLSVWQSPVLNASNYLAYVQPAVNKVKVREINARANVEFPVNQTVLIENFRNNYAELQTVRGSIDSVRNDRDVQITAMSIKGFASPEGSWTNNDRLAKGRTEALKNYVEQLYSFPKGFINTSYEAEDWNGLRDWVEASNINRRDEILEVIDNTSLSPDAKDARLKNSFPTEYAMLLNTVYPSLRHSDYRIEYTVKHYSNPEEILKVMRTRPGNLDLDELHLAAQSLTPGSDEFNEVYEVAVRLYPEDETANLNAAMSALQRNDTSSAERYLQKAGNSTEAQTARGVLAAMNGDYEAARGILKPLAGQGNDRAASLLERVEGMEGYKAALDAYRDNK